MGDAAVMPKKIVHLLVNRAEFNETAAPEVAVGNGRGIKQREELADDGLFRLTTGDEKTKGRMPPMQCREDLTPGLEAPILAWASASRMQGKERP